MNLDVEKKKKRSLIFQVGILRLGNPSPVSSPWGCRFWDRFLPQYYSQQSAEMDLDNVWPQDVEGEFGCATDYAWIVLTF